MKCPAWTERPVDVTPSASHPDGKIRVTVRCMHESMVPHLEHEGRAGGQEVRWRDDDGERYWK